MNSEKSRNAEYKKSAALLSLLVGLDADAEERVYRCFQNMGVDNFFLYLESLELGLSQEATEKLKSLKVIIDIFSEGRGQA
ncbi:hypothetical protein SAMN02745133_03160 [Desulforamulus putei DSM 12395]|uniref:Uncharacterized protein n=1 Tax=Desulforamulus putei DSM 12395 TaxID=1121429 RepID=A0A1M5DBS7_9FIRM|nr:hypothetical protein [Desulforamulus putei]SHF64483.1 hypothetical protein SAMN02745133_03160 [Desulforamulus putei DSM 12395]